MCGGEDGEYRGRRGLWDGELRYLVAGWMGMLEAALSVMRI